eukprot:s3211_g1.t2
MFFAHKYWVDGALPSLYLPSCTDFTFRRGDCVAKLTLYLPRVKDLNLDANYDLRVLKFLKQGHASQAEWNLPTQANQSNFSLSCQNALLGQQARQELLGSGRLLNGIEAGSEDGSMGDPNTDMEEEEEEDMEEDEDDLDTVGPHLLGRQVRVMRLKSRKDLVGKEGLGINEVYGMSESCGGATLSTQSAHLWGSCGFPVDGVEVKVFKVDATDINKKTECPRTPSLDDNHEDYQGEVCFRGRHIMTPGHCWKTVIPKVRTANDDSKSPDFGPEHVKSIEKKTAEAIDAEGWMHSGDKGMMTASGMLKITGSIVGPPSEKQRIIGDGGENIAPDHIKASCDGINEVMMVGDKRKYNVALITLKAVGANGEVPGTDNLDAGAKRVNPDVTTISAALDDKVWIEAVTKAVTSANNNGKICPNNAFKVQKFMILPTNFSEEQGFLTPTKKLKRPIVEKAFIKQVDQMYASKETYVRYQP